ncbi:MAG: class E sortase [Methanobrevibacter sp.]|uniref:class E sortase n=1 Tax=Methanobrevibacter sp. TaxID=66852 RepID=UPI0025DE39C9|nr:class E sortase [Methanobrevibacter sp.]MBQ6099414.1 class E sortase [Methanobrevibacter sp.]
MNKPTISTIVIIICILIIGLYALGEVNYFSTKVSIERNIESPAILIPSIGVNEKLNNVSLSQGVLHEPTSYNPLDGDVLLFGHRTLQGSPFLRLNELNSGDKLVLEWPGIGEITYTVTNSTIVPATYELVAQEGGNKLYLITCDPIGSTENRLIIQGEVSETNPLNTEIIKDNPQESNAWIISAIFLIVGIIFSFIYPKNQRIFILAAVLIISAILFYCCMFPIPSEIIYDKINFLNGGL